MKNIIKKAITIIISVIATTAILVSCQSPKTLRLIDDNFYLYQNYYGGADDTTTPLYQWKSNGTNEQYIKDGMDKKEFTIFGRSITMSYIDTWNNNLGGKNIDGYHGRYGAPETNGLVFIDIDEKTGNILSYDNYDQRFGAGTDRTYQSEVNPNSNEAAFIVYAKSLIAQYGDIEGYELTIQTKKYDDRGYSQMCDGFIGNTENKDDYKADYIFTFHKTISGVPCSDVNTITVNNTGEVCEMRIGRDDNLFAPFKEVQIDINKIEENVKTAVSRLYLNGFVTVYEKTTHELVVWDGVLCVISHAEVKYDPISTPGEYLLHSAVDYITQVAEWK